MDGTPLLVHCVPSGMTKNEQVINLVGVGGKVEPTEEEASEGEA